jgi:glycosyltransferase involved in cell wall biosynthesis
MGPWRIVELDLDRPLPEVKLAPEEDGMALALWRGRRPVGFVLHPTAPGARLAPAELEALIVREAGLRVLEDAVGAKLARPRPAPAPRSLTIAVCTRDRPALVDRLLASLHELRQPSGTSLPLEVLVVDNAPSDEGTRRLVARHPGVRYALEPCPGLDFARNRALAAASGELIAYLDDDVTVDPGWLEGLAEALAESPDLGALTGQVLPLSLATPAQVMFERRGGFRHGFVKARWGRECSVAGDVHPCHAGIFGAGCNMVFERSLLLRLGGFDEALDTGPPLPGGGDLDIFYRVVRAGRPLVYEPSMLVRHEHRREMAQLRRQYWSWGLGFMAYLVKCRNADPALWPRQRRLIVWWLADELRQIRKSLLGRHPLPVGFLLAELWGALQGLAGGYRRSRRRVAALRSAYG